MSKRKIKLSRIFAVLMLFGIMNQIFFPSVALALTNGSTQPEVWGYQPVDATDNVSLTTGKFNYTIPITSIPEFPMAIGYNSGLGMDQEASTFGYGFNGFSGAISRSINGLPDDLNGTKLWGDKVFSFGNEAMWDAKLGMGINLGLQLSDYFTVGANATTVYGYNNYNGFYGAIGTGVSIGLKVGVGNIGNPSIGVGIYNDSRESAPRFGASAGLSLYGSSVQLSGTQSMDNKGWQYSASVSNSGVRIDNRDLGINIGNGTNYPANNAKVSSTLASMAFVIPRTGGTALAMSFSWGAYSINTEWSKYKIAGGKDIRKQGLGFLYLDNYDRSNYMHISDMTIEGEDSYNDASYNNPSYLQKDNYNVSTMGISGAMEVYQKNYGVVSRNYSSKQTNKRNTYSTKTDIEEVHPWYAAKQVKINKSLDILAILKQAVTADYEVDDVTNVAAQLLEEKERANFNGPNQRFDSDPIFKMRGDYAGEYDLSSSTFDDHEVNPYSLIHVSGTSSDPQFDFLGVEKNVPLYFPNSNVDYNSYASSHSIERSTNIKRHSIGMILNSYASFVNYDNSVTPVGGTNPLDPFNFNQSFYCHYNYKHSNSVKSNNVILNNDIENFSLLKHLKELRDATVPPPISINGISGPTSDPNASYFNDLIGSIEMQTTNGLKYYFNLPVFNKVSKSDQLLGKGVNAPIVDQNGYHSYSRDGGHHERNKISTTDEFMYPYAWLLTAIVGDDYIDFDNIPGPSDGDIGYWIKFKYVKTADSYRWRYPFTGMSHYPGIIHKTNDDYYSVSSGTKEIYCLSEIESSNYLCKYNYQKRFDGVDAKGHVNGDAKNLLRESEVIGASPDMTGDNFQFVVTQIDLYKKHNDGNNSSDISESNQKIIKSTKFYYDYTTSSNIPNNYLKYSSSIAKSNLPYHIDFGTSNQNQPIEKGKLTLRKIQHIAYDDTGLIGSATYLPSYSFSYFGDTNSDYNPAYDPRCVDQWGNYMRNSKNDVNGISYYKNYPEYVKSEADENAKVFKLKSISLPSGGIMEIDYEAQSYGFVEDKTPFAMRNVRSISHIPSTSTATIQIDVTDIGSLGFSDPNATTTNANGEEQKILKVGDKIYGEIAFYRSTISGDVHSYKPYNTLIINEEVTVSSLGSVSLVNSRYYQDVVIQSQNGEKPFITQCETFMYGESEEMRATKDNLDNSPLCESVQDFRDKYEAMNLDSQQDAIAKIVAHGNNLTTSPSGLKNKIDNCFGIPGSAVYQHWSYVRTPIFKGKYTGAVVKSIKIKDGFQYATLDNGSVGANDNEYGTNYFYDLKSNGSSTSSGVATNEPGGGKSNVIDVYASQGTGFMQAPTVLYSRTTVENAYKIDGTTASNGDIISRKKGKTVYEFYTPKESGLQFLDHFKEESQSITSPIKGNFFLFGVFTFFMIKVKILGKTVPIKFPHFVPIILDWKLDDQYHVKSYSYSDYTDVFGSLKTVKQFDAFGEEIGSQNYKYYDINEEVPVYKNGFTSGTGNSSKKPGKVDQVWSESYYTKKEKIELLTLYCKAKTEKDFCYTNMKYSYIPPVLKEISSTIDGLTTKTSYTGFDYYTGVPIEARSSDSYNNTKISRSVPAYWMYPEMGPRSVNDNYVNNLKATTGTYMYLNQIDNSHLLAAGVVKWTKGNLGSANTLAKNYETWGIVPYLQPKKSFVNTTTHNYMYNLVSGNTIKNAYSVSLHASDIASSVPKVPRNSYLYKPYKGYTYEVALNTDGTFKSYTPFDYSLYASNAKWKLISTNDFYSQNGVLVQSKDALAKYAAQLLGYNSSNTVAATSNASWASIAFEGAENMYISSTGNVMLEDDKVKLLDAKIQKACDRTFRNEVLTTSDFNPSGGFLTANVLNVTMPSVLNYNVPFVKINVTYSHNTSISRSLYLSINDNNEFQIMSNIGEVFEGFFVYPQPSGAYKLLFNPNDFAAFSLDNSFTLPSYSASLALNTSIPQCSMASKPYQLPEFDCPANVHTGSYAFVLQPGNTKGTDFVLSTSGSTLTTSEFKRKYKAMVWVHNTSPVNTELVMQITNSTGSLLSPEVKTSKATPYAIAGDWSLLRLDFDLTNLNLTSPYVHVFVRNASNNAIATYDDFRVLPFHADMTNWIFEHKFNRVVSGLDADNFASYSAYDNRGRVIESIIELQNTGKKTVQKFMYNDQKTN